MIKQTQTRLLFDGMLLPCSYIKICCSAHSTTHNNIILSTDTGDVIIDESSPCDATFDAIELKNKLNDSTEEDEQSGKKTEEHIKLVTCSLPVDIHTCMHAYMHAYMHTYMHTYIHT